MNPALAGVAAEMKALGLGALTHALRLSLYIDPNNKWWSELSVLNAAHAAELLIKARIAEEHPLLVFEEFPKPSQSGTWLDFEDLFTRGKTIDFRDIPDRLWATTGIRLPAVDVYYEFGKYRNAIQHFSPPTNAEASTRTLRFVFSVLDPFIHANWKLYAIDFNEEFGDHYEHIFDRLVEDDIRPLISPEAAQYWHRLGYAPADDAPLGYVEWFEASMTVALKGGPK